MARHQESAQAGTSEKMRLPYPRQPTPKSALAVAKDLLEIPEFNHKWTQQEKLRIVRFVWGQIKRWNDELDEQGIAKGRNALDMSEANQTFHKWCLSQFRDADEVHAIEPSPLFGGHPEYGECRRPRCVCIPLCVCLCVWGRGIERS